MLLQSLKRHKETSSSMHAHFNSQELCRWNCIFIDCVPNADEHYLH